MAEIAGSLYLLSTAIFALLAIAIGVRLIRLSARTGQPAERMLGLGIVCTAALGYGVMMVGLIGRGMAGGDEAPVIFAWLTRIGWVFHNLGVLCMLRFVLLVFRPDETWARVLAIAMGAVLWGAWFVYLAQGGASDGLPRPSYWVMFSVIGTYPLWTGVEAFRYYAMMRRRVALGLAEPLVANRFLLWGLASACAVASIWTINVPSFMGVAPGQGGALMPVCMLLTAGFGMGTVGLYWLTFFPPQWYRARVRGTGLA